MYIEVTSLKSSLSLTAIDEYENKDKEGEKKE